MPSEYEVASIKFTAGLHPNYLTYGEHELHLSSFTLYPALIFDQ
jgi:hypothetical protein